MARGQRFELNLDSDGEEGALSSPSLQSFSFVKDITEHDTTATPSAPPPPPKPSTSNTGFPLHKKRVKPSRFKLQNATGSSAPAESARPSAAAQQDNGRAVPRARMPLNSLEGDRKMVDDENKQLLASMTGEEIEEQRRELLSGAVPGLTPSLIERLLKRANIDEGRTDVSTLEPETPKEQSLAAKTSGKRVTFEETGDEDTHATSKSIPSTTEPPQLPSSPSSSMKPVPQLPQRTDPDAPPRLPPSDLQPATSRTPLKPVCSLSPNSTFHFASPASQHKLLDPSAPTFLSDLREKYFPDLPATASSSSPALAWLQDPDSDPNNSSSGASADPAASYSASATSLPPSALRFDFRGRLLPPSVSNQLPTTLGLHHHGLAPAAAGYTVPELALLARSTVAAQRAVAHQTLGRILYRLGKGEFGSPDGQARALYEGLWRCVEEGRGLDAMVREAGGGADGGVGQWTGQGSRSAWAVATEAVWLWRLGGGKSIAAN